VGVDADLLQAVLVDPDPHHGDGQAAGRAALDPLDRPHALFADQHRRPLLGHRRRPDDADPQRVGLVAPAPAAGEDEDR
jgi:hypothetical protein